LGVFLETLSVLRVECGKPVICNQSLIRLVKLCVKITYFFHNFFLIKAKLNGFIETQVGLRKTFKPCGQA